MSKESYALIGVVAGALLSGLVNAALAWWKDRKDRRAAVRLVRIELLVFSAWLGIRPDEDVDTLYFLQEHPPVTFREKRETIAREVAPSGWVRVSRAYALYEELVSNVTKLADLDDDEGLARQTPYWDGLETYVRDSANDLQERMTEAEGQLAPLGLRTLAKYRARASQAQAQRLVEERDGQEVLARGPETGDRVVGKGINRRDVTGLRRGKVVSTYQDHVLVKWGHRDRTMRFHKPDELQVTRRRRFSGKR